MIRKRFSLLPLHYRLSIASIIPLLLITLGLAGQNIQTRKADLDRNIALMAQTRTNYIAKEADVALFSNDIDALQKMMPDMLKLQTTQGLMFLDEKQNVITQSSNFQQPSQPLSDLLLTNFFEGEFFYYAQPVFLSGIDFTDYESEFTGASQETLAGWILISLNISEQRSQYLSFIYTTLLVALISFSVAIIISYLLGRSILMPIRSLTDTVTQIKEGDLSARTKIYPHREFALLGEVINNMADTIEKGAAYLETRAGDATFRLHATLTDLQQKNHELQMAREQSERSNQSKSEFLARMSHELRTPITSIQGFARLLNDSAMNDIDRQHCHIIDQAANQLLLLIDDILDYSKIQSNTVVIDNQPFNLIETVEQIADQFSLEAHNKSIEFIVDINPSLAPIRRGDEKRIRQIINNLLSNAIKFTHQGGVYITLSESTEPGVVRISVRDTGIGIKSSQRDQLFQAFSQADTSISRQFGGTGLGLSITHALTDLMHGELFFYSTEGKGSDFIAEIPLEEISHDWKAVKSDLKVLVYHWSKPAFNAISNILARLRITAVSAESTQQNIEFPLAIYYLPPATQLQEGFSKKIISDRAQRPNQRFILISPVTNIHNIFSTEELKQIQPAIFITNPPSILAIDRAINQKSLPTQPAELPKSHLLKNLNILIAEDNQLTCLLLETLVENYGGIFSTATNGLEAVKITQSEPFDVILIDVHMPELNGVEAIRRIRRGKSVNKNTPIIALTADIQQQDKRNLLAAGANEMLLKPFDENRLIKAIRQQIGLEAISHRDQKIEQPLVSKDVYIAELNALTNHIDNAIKQEDWPQVGEYIHQLLGVTGIFSLDSLEQSVALLHRTFKAKNYTALNLLLPDIRKEISQATENEPAVK